MLACQLLAFAFSDQVTIELARCFEKLDVGTYHGIETLLILIDILFVGIKGLFGSISAIRPDALTSLRARVGIGSTSQQSREYDNVAKAHRQM